VEIMLEKNAESPMNLWCLQSAAGTDLIRDLKPKLSLSAKLRTSYGKNGKLQYGRHSALEKMDQLGEADLVCFAPETLRQLGQIIDRLQSVRPIDLL